MDQRRRTGVASAARNGGRLGTPPDPVPPVSYRRRWAGCLDFPGPGGGLKAPGLSPPPNPFVPQPSRPSPLSTTAASVLSGELCNQIDGIGKALWSGGIANPLEVLEERKAQRTGQPMARRLFPDGEDAHKRSTEQLRWSRFKHQAAGENNKS